jgi:hypothetical protein
MDDPRVCSVTSDGIAWTGSQYGRTELVVTDAYTPDNYERRVVYVVPPDQYVVPQGGQ